MLVGLTGADGLIGSAIAKSLALGGHRLRKIGRRNSSDIFFDLGSGQSFDSNQMTGVEVLVHAAGVTDEDFANPIFVANKSLAASALVNAAVSADARYIVYVSSAHVYGHLCGRINEASRPNPITPYGRAHLTAEQTFIDVAQASGIAVFILRPCAVYGMPPSIERFNRWNLIPFDFPRQALGGRIVLKSDGVQRRNFVATSQLGNEVTSWLANHKAGTTVANSPGPDEMSIYDFAMRCASHYKKEFGADCVVQRPSSANSHPEGLRYESLRATTYTPDTLDAHVVAMMKKLREIAR